MPTYKDLFKALGIFGLFLGGLFLVLRADSQETAIDTTPPCGAQYRWLGAGQSCADSMAVQNKIQVRKIIADSVIVFQGTRGISAGGGGSGDITGVKAGTGLSGGGDDGEVTLSVTNPFTSDDESKLDGIASGAEVNVQADWNASSGDAFIANKPTIPSLTGYTRASVAEAISGVWNFASGGLELPQAATLTCNTAAEGRIYYDTDNDDLYVCNGTAWQQLNVAAPVQSDWTATGNGLNVILNKPTIPPAFDLNDAVTTQELAIADDDRLLISDQSASGDPNEYVRADSLASFVEGKLRGAKIGDLAFSNPPSDLSDSEKQAARTAIGAGTGSGGSAFDLYADVTTQELALAGNDRMVIADVSETGEPNEYTTLDTLSRYVVNSPAGRRLHGDLSFAARQVLLAWPGGYNPTVLTGREQTPAAGYRQHPTSSTLVGYDATTKRLRLGQSGTTLNYGQFSAKSEFIDPANMIFNMDIEWSSAAGSGGGYFFLDSNLPAANAQESAITQGLAIFFEGNHSGGRHKLIVKRPNSAGNWTQAGTWTAGTGATADNAALTVNVDSQEGTRTTICFISSGTSLYYYTQQGDNPMTLRGTFNFNLDKWPFRRRTTGETFDAWSSGTTYDYNSTVRHNSKDWRCRASDNNCNLAPPNSEWEDISSVGDGERLFAGGGNYGFTGRPWTAADGYTFDLYAYAISKRDEGLYMPKALGGSPYPGITEAEVFTRTSETKLASVYLHHLWAETTGPQNNIQSAGAKEDSILAFAPGGASAKYIVEYSLSVSPGAATRDDQITITLRDGATSSSPAILTQNVNVYQGSASAQVPVLVRTIWTPGSTTTRQVAAWVSRSSTSTGVSIEKRLLTLRRVQ